MGMGVLIKTKESFLLEGVTITPTKAQQVITPANNYYGLSYAIVEPIPETYNDTTDATASAEHIVDGETAYGNSGKMSGTMPNNGAISATFDGMTNETYTVPAGYHNGSGTVSLDNTIENALAAI